MNMMDILYGPLVGLGTFGGLLFWWAMRRFIKASEKKENAASEAAMLKLLEWDAALMNVKAGSEIKKVPPAAVPIVLPKDTIKIAPEPRRRVRPQKGEADE